MSGDFVSVEALAKRVEALERQGRRLKVLLFSSLVLVLSLGAVAGTFAAQKALTFSDAYGKVSVSSEGVYLYDKAGVARLAMYITSKGEPVIRLKDKQNRARSYFGLTADSESPRVEFDDTSGTQRLFVGLTTQETGLVRMFTKSGGRESSLEDDFMRIGDSNGNERVYLGQSSENEPILEMYDSSHNHRIYAGLYTDGKAGFTSYDTSGSSLWSSP